MSADGTGPDLPTRADVIVVGGGPAALAAASEAAQRGLAVLQRVTTEQYDGARA